jgi:hypothetical protein
MVGALASQSPNSCTDDLSTHDIEGEHVIQNFNNSTFKQTNVIKKTAVTEGSK